MDHYLIRVHKPSSIKFMIISWNHWKVEKILQSSNWTNQGCMMSSVIQFYLQKIKILGFTQNTLNIFTNYLKDRLQYVEIDIFSSDLLLVGPTSVTQGSTLSCILYLIFIMDIMDIFHNKPHKPLLYKECSTKTSKTENGCAPINAKTYVDDNIVHTRHKEGQTLKEAVINTIKRIQDYTNSNCLALNPDKSKVMLLTNKQTLKDNFNIQIGDKTIKHQNKLLILGNLVTDDLK